MRNSKYIGMQSGEWTCTHIGVAFIQPRFLKGTKTPSKRPHHQTYYYIFERPTHDHTAQKMVRVSAQEIAKIADPLHYLTVEEVAQKKKARSKKHPVKFVSKVSYSF